MELTGFFILFFLKRAAPSFLFPGRSGDRSRHTHVHTASSHSFAGQLAGSLHPGGELSFVEQVVLMDVEVAHFLLPGLAGGDRTHEQRVEADFLAAFWATLADFPDVFPAMVSALK
jgi:hypothetical protein